MAVHSHALNTDTITENNTVRRAAHCGDPDRLKELAIFGYGTSYGWI